jgi:hypothetical protein
VTPWGTVFVVRWSRRAAVAQELLGEDCWRWVVTDRWRTDGWSPTWRRQLGGAPLWRDIDAMVEHGGRSREIGEALPAQARQMVHGWQRVRDGTLAHPSFASYLGPIRREVERLLAAGQPRGVPKTQGVCREILPRQQALWTFHHTGVEPTNNAARRAIRPGGLWRQGSVGTHRPEGTRFVEAMRTGVATLKQQHRTVLDSLTAACEAVLCDEPGPLLTAHP